MKMTKKLFLQIKFKIELCYCAVLFLSLTCLSREPPGLWQSACKPSATGSLQKQQTGEGVTVDTDAASLSGGASLSAQDHC